MSNNDKVFVNSDNKMLRVVTIQENSSQIHIKLNGVDYRVWSKIMEMYIIGHMKKGYISKSFFSIWSRTLLLFFLNFFRTFYYYISSLEVLY